MTTAEDVKGRVAQRAQGDAPSTEVAPTDPPKGPNTIGELIQVMRGELARALPKHMDADRMARVALTALRKTPALSGCSKESFAGALLTAASLGLEPDINGECYLVPYGRECTFIIGYRGFAKLFWQNPLAKHLDCQAVHANDEFDYAYGLEPYLRHKPAHGHRGEIIYYYAVASLSTGGQSFVVLTPEQVKSLRGGKVGPKGNIADPMAWMERKTALRQVIKLLPMSASLVQALEADEQDGSRLYSQALQQAQIETAPQREIEGQVEQQPEGPVHTGTGEIVGPEPGDASFEQAKAAAAGEPAQDELGGADPEGDTAWPEPAAIPSGDQQA